MSETQTTSERSEPVSVNLGCGSIGCAGVILALAVLFNMPAIIIAVAQVATQCQAGAL